MSPGVTYNPEASTTLRASAAGMPAATRAMLAPVMAVRHPDAGFYLWAGVPGGDDVIFARDLLAATNVSVLPGQYLARDAHGVNPGRGYVRMALVPELTDCVEAARRIGAFLRSSPNIYADTHA